MFSPDTVPALRPAVPSLILLVTVASTAVRHDASVIGVHSHIHIFTHLRALAWVGTVGRPISIISIIAIFMIVRLARKTKQYPHVVAQRVR